jgi:hypothetical protein
MFFLHDDPNKGKWGLEGAAELTSIGKMQAFVLGQMMRDRYSKLLDPHFLPKQVTKWLHIPFLQSNKVCKKPIKYCRYFERRMFQLNRTLIIDDLQRRKFVCL